MQGLVLIVSLLALCFSAEARICYNCTGDCVRDSDCKGSCTTSVPELGGDEVRSCINDTQEARCISDDQNGVMYKVCFCNTERCNHAATPPLLLPLVLLAPLVLLRLR